MLRSLTIFSLAILIINTMTLSAGASVRNLFGESYALVIGIGNYQHHTKLRYAKKDAVGIAKYLKEQMYSVIELYDANATKGNILAAIEDRLIPRLRNHDRVLLFFSGHGATRIISNEDYGYIVPYDGQLNFFSSWIAMETIQQLSNKMKTARHQYLIVDACYGGQIGTKSTTSGISQNHPYYIYEVAKRQARQYLSAGGKDQKVLDGGPQGYSYFTGFLLKALREGTGDLNGDGYITASELSAYLTPLASNWNQTPGSGTLPGHGAGDFLFELPGAPEISAPPNIKEYTGFKGESLPIKQKIGVIKEIFPEYRMVYIELETGLSAHSNLVAITESGETVELNVSKVTIGLASARVSKGIHKLKKGIPVYLNE